MTPALQSVLSPAGPDAALLSRFSWLLFAAGAVIFLLVALLVLASVVRKRGRSWSRRLVVGGGLFLPVPLLAALMGWSGRQASLVSWPFSGTRIQVSVTSYMWWWEVRYRDTLSGREAVLANELRLPAGERVYLALASADVLHAFWVPALAGKVDMVPGRLHGLTLRADAPGRYRGQCAEYCGAQHAAMALDVVAVAPQEFDAWLARQGAPANTLAHRGREVFLAARCNACHAVRGVSDGGALGPDLTHVGSRTHIAAGALPMNRAALIGWIADPQAAKPGARMPPSNLSPQDLQALAGWLEELR
ncbi:cytochrome c oxidase subunit 2 [Duganella sp. CF458]|uniref:cytochrome c oxidase subunit II n=1 Tax=Duganella sp. CF458 TaxID=1884368 RepID=UPI0008E35677|nr:cytochrome c oxidase subunit II [Duganella sp. CF458]SFG11350.1 cytochrome c oxidase subunit 2 [Duganella sp. CF458]